MATATGAAKKTAAKKTRKVKNPLDNGKTTKAKAEPKAKPAAEKKVKPPKPDVISLPTVSKKDQPGENDLFIVSGTMKTKAKGELVTTTTVFYCGRYNTPIPGVLLSPNSEDAATVTKDELDDVIADMSVFLPDIEKADHVSRGDRKAWDENLAKIHERQEKTRLAVENWLEINMPQSKWSDAEMHMFVYVTDMVNRGYSFKRTTHAAGLRSYKPKGDGDPYFYRVYHALRALLKAAGKEVN